MVAQPTPEWLELAEIAFTRFYLLDFGPLAPSEYQQDRLVLRQGLAIALPNDPARLATIQARFVLAEH